MKCVFFASVALNLLLLGCASEPISTWIVAGGQLEHNVGANKLAQTCAQAEGYRCYSEADDLMWRNRMALCCAQAGM